MNIFIFWYYYSFVKRGKVVVEGIELEWLFERSRAGGILRYTSAGIPFEQIKNKEGIGDEIGWAPEIGSQK